MGPNENVLEAVKRDAINTTIRHFKDEMLDNDYEPQVDLDEVRRSLLADHGGVAVVDKTEIEEADVVKTRTQLNDEAVALGIDAPEKLKTKQEVIDAIATAQAAQ